MRKEDAARNESIRSFDLEPAEVEEVGQFQRCLGASGSPVALSLPSGEAIPFPPALAGALRDFARALAGGKKVSLVEHDRFLTTQEAADLIGFSRQYLARLLDKGIIPSFKTGSHRRVRAEDALAYKAKREARARGLEELSSITEEAGGYEQEN